MRQNSLGGAADLRTDDSEILAAKQAARKKYKIMTVCISAVLVIAVCCLIFSQLGNRDIDSPSLDNMDTGLQIDSSETNAQNETTQNPNLQVEWSDWVDSMPSYVNDESYVIEEQILYRSRNLETTSSTTQNTMDGWELYDTIEGTGDFGNWSDWSAMEVGATDTREVERQTRYRYRDKETTTGSSSTLSGWELYDTTYSWGGYGNWSDWSTTAVTGSDSRKVETKTQYRYRDIWITQEYSDWSGWSGWQDSQESTSDLKKEESRTVWGYYYFQCPACGAHMHGWDITCPTWAGGCGEAYIPESSWHVVWSTVSWDNAGLKDWHGTGKYYTYIDGELVFKWTEGGSKTQYRYATRTLNNVTNYGSWSDWRDTVYSASSTREVQTRTVYRYCDRQQIPTYHFYRWGSWSDWSANAVSQTNNRQVETMPYYRYRDRVTVTTYYFKRWGNWSNYTTTHVAQSDTVDVETKTQYRYKSK